MISFIRIARFAPRRALFVAVAVVFSTLALSSNWNHIVVNAASGAAQAAIGNDAAKAEFFEKQVRPVLTEHCYDCHATSTRSAGGLRVDDREALLTGGKSGAAINLEKPDESLMLQRILSTDTKKRMPKGEDDPLPAETVANVRKWIAEGAFWPVTTPAAENRSALDAGAQANAKGVVKILKVAYPRPATSDQLAYFEKNVRPILVNNCYNCHSEAFKEAGGLRVDVGMALLQPCSSAGRIG